MKLALSAGAVALSMALVGCGGGSSPRSMMDGDNMMNGKDDDPEFTDARCVEINGAGHVANAAGDGCMDDPDHVSADAAREAAEELYGNIDTASTAIAHMAGSGADSFAMVKDEYKGSKSFYAKGLTFAAANAGSDDTDSVPNASGAANAGYHELELVATGLEVTSSKFSRATTPVNFDASSGAFSGEYQGIPGMFLCVATGLDTCSSAPGTKDTFILTEAGSATWLFKPNSETATTSKGAKLAEWGWWIENQGEEDEIVRLFYGDTMDSDAPDPVDTTLTITAGTATYKGDALGQYAVVRSGTGSASGEFEAKVTLTADFEAGANGELSGEIHDFNVGTEWKVMLEKKAIAGGTALISGETKWMMGTDEGLRSGNWSARMHGGDGGEETPTHILGGFSAVHSNASMIGAFGTELEKPGN